jgi:hypothetical protein
MKMNFKTIELLQKLKILPNEINVVFPDEEKAKEFFNDSKVYLKTEDISMARFWTPLGWANVNTGKLIEDEK